MGDVGILKTKIITDSDLYRLEITARFEHRMFRSYKANKK